MGSISYFEAWSLWWDGQKLEGLQIFGWPVLYWGRAGKISQFVGGFVALLDLIGKARLDDTAKRVQLWSAGVHKFFLRFKQTRKTSEGADITSAELILMPLTFALHFAILFTAIGFAGDFTLSSVIGDGLLATFLTLILITLPVIPAFYLALTIVSQIHRIISAAAWLFTSSKPGHPVRWVAFIVFSIGFKFDLLAS